MADFVIKEWDLAPYPGDQAPPHVHHTSDEAFYVLDGELEVLEGNKRRALTAGELASQRARFTRSPTGDPRPPGYLP